MERCVGNLLPLGGIHFRNHHCLCVHVLLGKKKEIHLHFKTNYIHAKKVLCAQVDAGGGGNSLPPMWLVRGEWPHRGIRIMEVEKSSLKT